MPVADASRDHATIVNTGIDYIFDHLFDDLAVEQIADHCGFSRYYFNRLFRSVTGESVYAYIKRLRLETAAFKLVKFPHLSITTVAADLGYTSSNFAVLFKEHYKVPPSRFRIRPRLPSGPGHTTVLRRIQELQKNKPEALLSRMDRRISFEDLPKLTFRYRRYQGSYRHLPSVWKEFCREMEHLFSGTPIVYYGISYNDPLIAGEEQFLYDLCADAPRICGGNYRTVPEGRYLCYRFDDHIRELRRTYNDLFAVWMPHRGYTMGAGLCLERYHTGMTPGGRIILDLCIPVA